MVTDVLRRNIMPGSAFCALYELSAKNPPQHQAENR
jgi:hypothetical protein